MICLLDFSVVVVVFIVCVMLGRVVFIVFVICVFCLLKCLINLGVGNVFRFIVCGLWVLDIKVLRFIFVFLEFLIYNKCL